jgi:hypothetical protein
MFRQSILIAGLAAAMSLGGCGAIPQNASAGLAGAIQGNDLPVQPKALSAQTRQTIAEQLPTQALLLDVLDHPGTSVTTRVPPLKGTLRGKAEVAGNGNAALAANAAGVAAGGNIGGVAQALGALVAGNHSVNNVRTGFMADISEPTLDFYRPLTEKEKATPVRLLGSLYDEELGIVAALNDGKSQMCMRTPCVDMKIQFGPNSPEIGIQLVPYNSGAIAHGPGWFQLVAPDEKLHAPDFLPIGDNGNILFGIDPNAGMALVLPGVLPQNAYFSEEKLAALVAKDPAIANWYAVFNTPKPGSKHGEVEWTVARGGQVIGRGEIVEMHPAQTSR